MSSPTLSKFMLDFVRTILATVCEASIYRLGKNHTAYPPIPQIDDGWSCVALLHQRARKPSECGYCRTWDRVLCLTYVTSTFLRRFSLLTVYGDPWIVHFLSPVLLVQFIAVTYPLLITHMMSDWHSDDQHIWHLWQVYLNSLSQNTLVNMFGYLVRWQTACDDLWRLRG